jgi:hypothetical protein
MFSHSVLSLTASLAAIFALAPTPCTSQASEPPGLLGSWVERTQVCKEVVDPKRDTWIESSQPETNVLTLSKVQTERCTVKLTFRLTTRRGHGCGFEGIGHWNGKDRVVATNAETGCQLVLIHAGARIHTVVITENQCREHCGYNVSLNGSVLRRAR